jgi:hypothetical protein
MTAAITYGAVLREWSCEDVAATETLHAPGTRLAAHDHDPANLTIVLSGGFEECVGR